jgi:hypothetical protein
MEEELSGASDDGSDEVELSVDSGDIIEDNEVETTNINEGFIEKTVNGSGAIPEKNGNNIEGSKKNNAKKNNKNEKKKIRIKGTYYRRYS